MKIRRWFNQHGMILLVLIIIFSIGYYVVGTLKYTLETTPDIQEIGGPPNIETMLPMVIVVIVLVVVLEYLKRCEGTIKN